MDSGRHTDEPLVLRLGIGAATAVFGVSYAVLMSPYPYPAAERILAEGLREGGRLVRIWGNDSEKLRDRTVPQQIFNCRLDI
jgi:hypothetical protein